MKRNVLREIEKAGCRTPSKSRIAWEPEQNVLLCLCLSWGKVEVKVEGCIGEHDYMITLTGDPQLQVFKSNLIWCREALYQWFVLIVSFFIKIIFINILPLK